MRQEKTWKVYLIAVQKKAEGRNEVVISDTWGKNIKNGGENE